MALGSGIAIEAPAVAPARGGLLAVATVQDAHVHTGLGGATYLAQTCGVADAYGQDVCYPVTPGPDDDPREEKNFTQIDVVSGLPFTIYRAVECKDLTDDNVSWALTALQFGESVGVERGLLRGTFVSPETVDLTPASGTLSLVNGVAALEGYAASHYGGTPILHIPRSVVTRGLARTVFMTNLDWTVATGQGTPVANGGGYEDNLGPDGTVPDAGEAWLYITGHVTLLRTPVTSVQVPDVRNNNQQALAERQYTPLVECFVAAVRVTLEANDG